MSVNFGRSLSIEEVEQLLEDGLVLQNPRRYKIVIYISNIMLQYLFSIYYVVHIHRDVQYTKESL